MKLWDAIYRGLVNCAAKLRPAAATCWRPTLRLLSIVIVKQRDGNAWLRGKAEFATWFAPRRSSDSPSGSGTICRNRIQSGDFARLTEGGSLGRK